MNIIPDIEGPQQINKYSFLYSNFIQIKSNSMFDVNLQYPLLGMKNAINRCMVRKEVYDKLCKAYSYLPKGYKIRIYDGWRSFKLQQELYDSYSKILIEKFQLNGLSEEDRRAYIKSFISEPICNREQAPVHTTGGAIDVTLLNSDNVELDMGTKFDEFTDKTYTAYFEKEFDENITYNRRLLYDVMIRAGFTNLPSEWWHYDYGDMFWAYYNQSKILYNGVFTMEEILDEGDLQKR